MHVVLHSIRPENNRYRRYEILVQPTLFGGVDLVRVWGRIGQRGGRTVVEHFEERDALERRLRAVVHLRARHGYEPVA